MSNIEERKRKLKELLAYSQKTSWRRKSLEKRIGEIVSYLTQIVPWFNVGYSDRNKRIIIQAYVNSFTYVRSVKIFLFLTSYSINKAIVIFLEQLLDDFKDYENTER